MNGVTFGPFPKPKTQLENAENGSGCVIILTRTSASTRLEVIIMFAQKISVALLVIYRSGNVTVRAGGGGIHAGNHLELTKQGWPRSSVWRANYARYEDDKMYVKLNNNFQPTSYLGETICSKC
ncbi:hypothetical protein PoB_005222200 [Plakobranchus ocellatus]|uniref:Uncharacterized protein n=1 Tax=Plakobranchus ocellatus TaxID=259542 RepID=A0AAV4C2W7_9GAST|nr:hypothetical protein PoB_005222200 [Plakobranchus ocellatus]